MDRKLKIYTTIVLVLAVLVSCNFKKASKLKDNVYEGKIETREFKTKSGKVFVVEIDNSMGASISTVQITTQEFTAVNAVHKIGTIDPVEFIFIADLDGNGFDEIYIVSRSAGSGSYANIYGVASNKDKSTTPIYVPEIASKQRAENGLFYGFMGHNTFTFEDGELLNIFPVYTEDDTNAKPTGGTRSVEYELIAGESGWILAPRSIVN